MELTRKITIGMDGEDVLYLQNKLSEYGFFTGYADGVFSEATILAYNNFQKHNNLQVTSHINLKTWNLINNYYNYQEIINTNMHESVLITPNNFKITDLLIDSSYYENEYTKKDTVCLHISNGSSNPRWTATNLRRIKKGNTYKYYINPYIIGGNIVIRTYDSDYWSHHMGTIYQSKRTIGIEICNNGELIKGTDNHFYTENNHQIESSNVYEYDGKYYEKITSDQIHSIVETIKFLIVKHNLSGNFLKLDGVFEQEEFKRIKNMYGIITE